MSAARYAPRARKGFTTVELVTSLAILALIAGYAGTLSVRTQDAYTATSRKLAVENRARRTMQRLVVELAPAGAATLFPRPDSDACADRLAYRRGSGVQDGEPQWEPIASLSLELDEGERDDGIDNDDDGQVDERCVVLTRRAGTPEEARVVLCRGVPELLEGEVLNGTDDNANGLVDEPGFSLSLEGRLLTIRLSVMATAEDGWRTVTETTSLHLRN